MEGVCNTCWWFFPSLLWIAIRYPSKCHLLELGNRVHLSLISRNQFCWNISNVEQCFRFLFTPTEGWGIYSFCQNFRNARQEETPQSIYTPDKHRIVNCFKLIRLSICVTSVASNLLTAEMKFLQCFCSSVPLPVSPTMCSTCGNQFSLCKIERID